MSIKEILNNTLLINLNQPFPLQKLMWIFKGDKGVETEPPTSKLKEQS